MTQEPMHLDSAQRHTWERLCRHPLATNLKWPQVLALLEAMGDVTKESKDRYRATLGEHTEVFHPPHHGDLPADMVVKLREFVKTPPGRSTPAGSASASASAEMPASTVSHDAGVR
jgi:hypothetical protein